MTEASWYYARENQEHGPVTAAQLKALVKKGEIESSDLVWKEGMATWSPAEEVRGLLDDSSPTASAVFRPADSTDGADSTPEAETPAPTSPTKLIDMALYGRWAGYAIMLLSLMFMMTMRGCTSVAARNEVRVQQHLRYVQSEFDRAAREKIQPLAEELRTLEESSSASQSRISSLQEDLSLATKKSREEKQLLESGEWADLETSIVSASATRATLGFYTQMGFLVASLALLLGLFTLAIFGQTPERWLSLIMVAVLLFGLIAFERM